ncbi:hypothetical protein MRB53_005701 [Persea americana]|uniref:Uncharacterized protein n=1 Tax=Persea americana TaxID=3435 RepID=A0ACC2MEL5_PERAE|nr:hypothetical protein MRB53_005701 [Persea americana]|eukprot:TRINITY_DN739_c0_g2_i1.p1 TRINITY_DN739_c0_g2~~TRINITY_DN739_c0_g2_i1.p1  ORF type:complete len:275 (+),score=68.87 TRINITY_DN739_c0_g2_i1:102-926(+)
MRIGAGLVEKSLESTKEKSRSNKKKRRGKKKPMPSGVQKLFDTCKEVFSAGGAGIVPSPGDVERLRLVLDDMKPADVGLNQEMTYFQRMKSKGAPPITYLHLYECDKFSIGIFCLPPSGVIPLHNHPGMTVFSKLLFGSMHIKSYDWADIPCSSDKTLNPSYFQPSGVQLAKVKTDAVFTAPCKPLILYPAAGGNMHCFTAKTSCAVLDVLGPPYNDSEGRHCTYYHDYPYASFSVDTELGSEREGCAWLEEREKPDDFIVVGAKYKGPKIVEN